MMFVFQAVIKCLEQERDLARGDVKRLEEEQVELRERLKVLFIISFMSMKDKFHHVF
jgi:hypothetical protein